MELNKNELQVILQIINQTNFAGSQIEVIVLLKQKIMSMLKNAEVQNDQKDNK